MKRKLTAFIMAAILAAAMVPSAVYAASDNRIPSTLFLSKKTTTDVDGKGSTSVTETYYDEEGNILREELSQKTVRSHVTQYTYSNDGSRLLKERSDYSDGTYNYTDYSYDAKNLLVRKETADSDSNRQIITYEYDSQGRLQITREDNNGQVSTYERSYDDRNNVSRIIYTDSRGTVLTTDCTWDSLNRKILETEKNAAGELTYSRKYAYDSSDRITSIVYTAYPEGGYTQTYIYSDDAYTVNTVYTDGRTESEVRSYDDKEPGYTYEYDRFGNVTKATYNRTETYRSSTLNTYDGKGNLLRSMTNDTSGNMTETVNEYKDGKLDSSTTTSSGAGTVSDTTRYSYDSNGFLNREDYTDSNGTVSAADYVNDEKGRVLSRKVTDNAGLTSETVYTYDSKGNVTHINTKTNQGFTYDVRYNYDTDGNRISMLATSTDGSAISAFYNYEKGNLISSVEVIDGETYYTTNTYDSEGKLLTSEQRTASDNDKKSVTRYEYNADGTLKRESSDNGSSVVYEYSKKSPFRDVKASDYFMDAVLWAVDKGITKGTSEDLFSPSDACTRAHAVTFLWRASGSPAPDRTKNPFKDVVKDAYYYDAVLWASQNQITMGTTETEFSPNDTCTRGQIVTFLWRSQKQPVAAGATVAFTDVAEDAFYNEAVKWAYVNDVTKGTSETEFSPNANCTRGQIVTFLYRALNK